MSKIKIKKCQNEKNKVQTDQEKYFHQIWQRAYIFITMKIVHINWSLKMSPMDKWKKYINLWLKEL